MRAFLLLLLPLTAFARTPYLPDGPPPEIRQIGSDVDAGVVALWSDDAFASQALVELSGSRERVATQLARAESQLLNAARFACRGEGDPVAVCESALGPAVQRLQCADDADTLAGALLEVSTRAAQALEGARLEAAPGNDEVARIERSKLRVAVERMRQVEIEAAACWVPEGAQGQALTMLEVGYSD